MHSCFFFYQMQMNRTAVKLNPRSLITDHLEEGLNTETFPNKKGKAYRVTVCSIFCALYHVIMAFNHINKWKWNNCTLITNFFLFPTITLFIEQTTCNICNMKTLTGNNVTSYWKRDKTKGMMSLTHVDTVNTKPDTS